MSNIIEGNLVEIQSYQKGIDYERERIKRIIDKLDWFINNDLKKSLFNKINDFEVER